MKDRPEQINLEKFKKTPLHGLFYRKAEEQDVDIKESFAWLAGLPDSGFYPEISGFFEADGIFLGNFFLAKTLGKNLGNSQEKFM